MSSAFIRAIVLASRSAAPPLSISLKSRNEGSFAPSTLFTASEKLSPGLFTAFSLEYAESSSEIVLVPMHLCMCIHALNHYAPLKLNAWIPSSPLEHRITSRRDRH